MKTLSDLKANPAPRSVGASVVLVEGEPKERTVAVRCGSNVGRCYIRVRVGQCSAPFRPR